MNQVGEKVSLDIWAQQFQPKPCAETLRRWVRNVRIYPEPELIGRAYYVDRNAKYVAAPRKKRRYGT